MNNTFFIPTYHWKDIPVEDWHDAYIRVLKEKDELEKIVDELASEVNRLAGLLGEKEACANNECNL